MKSCLGFDDRRNSDARILLFTDLCGIRKSSMRDLNSLLLSVEEQEEADKIQVKHDEQSVEVLNEEKRLIKEEKER